MMLSNTKLFSDNILAVAHNNTIPATVALFNVFAWYSGSLNLKYLESFLRYGYFNYSFDRPTLLNTWYHFLLFGASLLRIALHKELTLCATFTS